MLVKKLTKEILSETFLCYDFQWVRGYAGMGDS